MKYYRTALLRFVLSPRVDLPVRHRYCCVSGGPAVRASVGLLLLIAGAMFISPLHAKDFRRVLDSANQADVLLSSTSLAQIDAAQASVPPWRLLHGKNHNVTGRLLGSLQTANSVCIELRPYAQYDASYLLNYPEKFLFEAKNPKALTGNCGQVGPQQILTFRVYIDNRMNGQRPVKLALSTAGFDNGTYRISELEWQLQTSKRDGDTFEVVGGVGGSFTRSKWIRDPRDPDTWALYLEAEFKLVDDPAPQSDSAVTQREKQSGGRIQALKAFELRSITSASAALDRQAQRAIPEIGWLKGQTDNKLILQPLQRLSDPAAGMYCVRPVYVDGGRRFRHFARVSSGRWRMQQSDASQLENLKLLASCKPIDSQLVFPIYVDPRLALKPGSARFTIRQLDDQGKSFLLGNAKIDLYRGKRLVASFDPGQPWSDNPAVGYWARDQLTTAVFLSSGELQLPADATSERLFSVQYSPLLDPEKTFLGDAQLLVDGEVFSDYEIRGIASGTPIGWDVSKAQPESMKLCADEGCQREIAALEIRPSSSVFPAIPASARDGTLHLVVDWGPPGQIVASAVQSSRAVQLVSAKNERGVGTAASFVPSIRFGGYDKPLTSCVGRLVVDEQTSDTFSLGGAGTQLLDNLDWLDGFADTAIVRAYYDVRRGGGKCPVANLVSNPVSVEELRLATALGPIEHVMASAEPLFVGYVNLSDIKYKNSIARWRETLAFADSVYRLGRGQLGWADGLLYGASDNAGKVQERLVPSGNFATMLGDEQSFLEVAQSMQYNNSTTNGFFEEQMLSIADKLTGADIKLLYFDDLTKGCGDYQDAIDYVSETSGLTLSGTIVVAGIDNYAGQDALRSLPGNLAHVCYSSEPLTVYAFNPRERNLNLDWHKALDVILADLKATQFKE